jgi:hypothetical protein
LDLTKARRRTKFAGTEPSCADHSFTFVGNGDVSGGFAVNRAAAMAAVATNTEEIKS